jgi:hypothetical protein
MYRDHLINPIDMMPFIGGGSQTPDGKKRKLKQLYEADAKKALESGDTTAYDVIVEKIKALDSDEDNNNNNQNQ